VGIQSPHLKLGVPGGVIGGCSGNSCLINAGSWDHDECCAAHPDGHWCGVEKALSNIFGHCWKEWQKAKLHVFQGLSWSRSLDRCRNDTDGKVNFSEYCAVGGTIMDRLEVSKCCSRTARPFDPIRDAKTVLSQGARLHLMYLPFVCQGSIHEDPPPNSAGCKTPPPPPLKVCTTDAQCQDDEKCFMHQGNKVCLPYK
jgi:hypothetical protein